MTGDIIASHRVGNIIYERVDIGGDSSIVQTRNLELEQFMKIKKRIIPKSDFHITARQIPGYKTVYYYIDKKEGNSIISQFIGYSWVNKHGQFKKSPTLERFVKKHNL